MPSACYELWRVYENSKGQKVWRNEGAAPDGDCPSCPQQNYPSDGTWNGYSAACQNGSIVKMVANGTGGLRPGDVIQQAGESLKAAAACNGSNYRGLGPISNYF